MKITSIMRSLFFFIMTLILLSCADEEKGALDGKSFSYEVLHIRSGSSFYLTYSTHSLNPPIEYLESYNDDSYNHLEWDLTTNNWSRIIDVLPKECYKLISFSEGKYAYTKDEEITDSIFSVKFSNNKCFINVHAVKCSLKKGQELNCKLKTYQFNEGSYNIDNQDYYFGNYILVVNKDKATVKNTVGNEISSIPLIEFKGEIKGKCNYLDQIEEVNDLNKCYGYIVEKDDVQLIDDTGGLYRVFNLKEIGQLK